MMEPLQQEDMLRDILADAWDEFSNHFVVYVIAGLLMLLVSVASLGLLSGPMTAGFVMLVENRRRGEVVSATDIFDGFSHFGASVIATLLIALGVFIGSLLFVLPGLLFGLSMAFTFQAIAIDEVGATDAMGRSFNAIKENFGLATVVLIIVLVLSGIGGAVVFGPLLTVPFSLVLMTLAYDRIRAR
jgi:uncharacterized membrane protein